MGCGEEEVARRIDTGRVEPLGAATVLALNHGAEPTIADGACDGGRR